MEFLQLLTQLAGNYHMLSDEASVYPEYPKFKEHRGDMSIVSLAQMPVSGNGKNDPFLIRHSRILHGFMPSPCIWNLKSGAK